VCVRQRVVTRLRAKSAVYISRSRAPMTVATSVIRINTYVPFILLFAALLIALAFEFVNGFDDTANAVATVIYTRALPANFAVVWSGLFNLLGVLASSGAVAFGIVSLLPVELVLPVGSSAGFAMVSALLIVSTRSTFCHVRSPKNSLMVEQTISGAVESSK
jgi:inorganic phosphate transporter, PiT family